MSESPLQNVTARVPPEHKAELAIRAGDAGISSYLAELIRDHIEGGQPQAILETVGETRDAIAEQHADLRGLRGDLATVLESLLLNLTNIPPDEIERFVTANLRRIQPRETAG